MNRRIFDVVAYLTSRYGTERSTRVDPNEFRDELFDVGFEEDDVERALAWLRCLRRGGTVANPGVSEPSPTLRVPTADEARKLTAGARGFVLRMEKAGILDAAAREAVYERAVSLDVNEVGSDEIRVLVALVLASMPVVDGALVAGVLTGDLEGAYH